MWRSGAGLAGCKELPLDSPDILPPRQKPALTHLDPGDQAGTQLSNPSSRCLNIAMVLDHGRSPSDSASPLRLSGPGSSPLPSDLLHPHLEPGIETPSPPTQPGI